MYKNLAEFEFWGQRSNVKVTGDKKNAKVRHVVWESSSGALSSCGIFSAAVLGGAFLRRWENQCMLSSLKYPMAHTQVVTQMYKTLTWSLKTEIFNGNI